MLSGHARPQVRCSDRRGTIANSYKPRHSRISGAQSPQFHQKLSFRWIFSSGGRGRAGAGAARLLRCYRQLLQRHPFARLECSGLESSAISFLARRMAVSSETEFRSQTAKGPSSCPRLQSQIFFSQYKQIAPTATPYPVHMQNYFGSWGIN